MVQGRKPNLKRRERIWRLRAAGLTLSQIGKRLGVSRQAVHNMLQGIERSRTRSRSVPCAACGQAIVSAGALPSDAATALCLDCLGKRPEAPFGQRLKAYRLAAGLTKAELAVRCGLGRDAARKYEDQGVLPLVPTALRLVESLGVTPEDLGLKGQLGATPSKRNGRPKRLK
jgi:transcriptional regulator with XRE-family HTH domain